MLREAEVEDLQAAVGADDDVGRLEIPVHDAVLMRRLDRVAQLSAPIERFVPGYQAVREARGQRLALDVLHHDERAVGVLDDVEDGGDARMRESGRRSGLADNVGARVG